MDLASVIGATYLLTVAKQRRRRTSRDCFLIEVTSQHTAVVIEGFSDEDVSQITVTKRPELTYYRPE